MLASTLFCFISPNSPLFTQKLYTNSLFLLIYIIFENAQEILICIPLHTVVIGLEKTKYTVSEGNATILTVNVLEGAITQSVVVQISTNDGTAIGKYVHIILFFYVNGLSAVFDRTCTGP